MRRGHSVITSFGCPRQCKYCITRSGKSRVHLEEENGGAASYAQIMEFLKGASGKFSVSGGGDPLFNACKHMDFWQSISEACKTYSLKCDIHTSFEDASAIIRSQIPQMQEHVGRLVIHCFADTDLAYVARTNRGLPLRVVYVADDTLPIAKMCENEATADRLGIEYSYRELHGAAHLPYSVASEYAGNVGRRYPKFRYIRQADYNRYLFPDGTVSDTYCQS